MYHSVSVSQGPGYEEVPCPEDSEIWTLGVLPDSFGSPHHPKAPSLFSPTIFALPRRPRIRDSTRLSNGHALGCIVCSLIGYVWKSRVQRSSFSNLRKPLQFDSPLPWCSSRKHDFLERGILRV